MTNTQYPLQLCQQLTLDKDKEDGMLKIFVSAGTAPFEYDQKITPWFVDFEKMWTYHLRTFISRKSNPLYKAVGGADKKILETCGGWGSDSLLLLFLGHQVKTWEAHPIVAQMLEQAKTLALESGESGLQKAMANWEIVSGAFSPSAEDLTWAQVAYVDPMYPGHDKRKTRPSKEMEILRLLVGEMGAGLGSGSSSSDGIREKLVDFLGSVVVKRAPHAPELWGKPHHCINSKAVRFDVYNFK